MAAYISRAAYIVVGTTIRLVLVVVVCAAAFVVIVGVVLDDKCDRFVRRIEAWGKPEHSDGTAISHLVTERVNQ